jgi:hypothetical protein
MSFTRPFAVAVVVALTPVLTVGCGTGTAVSRPRHTGSVQTAAVARSRTEADAICARTNDELTTHAPRRPSRQTIAQIASTNATLEQRAVAQLGRLTVSASLRARWETILDDRRELARQLEEYAAARAQGDMPRAQALLKVKAAVRHDLLETAQAAGFAQCAHLG